MASIYPRKNKNGSTTWRVVFRRVGKPNFATSFDSEKEAKEFANLYEEKYCLGEDFIWDNLKHLREREFKRRKNHE